MQDFCLIALLYLTMLALTEDGLLPVSIPWPIQWLVVLPAYWFLQGTMFWALFVLGHDCGHGSFSNSTAVNDVTGNVLHSLILVPYYPWKLSHQHHHKNTGNIDKDEIFYPQRVRKGEPNNHMSFLPLFGFGIRYVWSILTLCNRIYA